MTFYGDFLKQNGPSNKIRRNRMYTNFTDILDPNDILETFLLHQHT